MYWFRLQFCRKFNNLYTIKVVVEVLQKSWFSLNFDRRMLKSQECIREWCNLIIPVPKMSQLWNFNTKIRGFLYLQLFTKGHGRSVKFASHCLSLFSNVVRIYPLTIHTKWQQIQLRFSSKAFFAPKKLKIPWKSRWASLFSFHCSLL